MTINLPTMGIAKSVWPKIFGGLGIVFQAFALAYYSNINAIILGLPAYIFLGVVAQSCNSLALFTVRQDDKSSEQVGAGVVPIPVSQEESIKSQIVELQKKLENKP